MLKKTSGKIRLSENLSRNKMKVSKKGTIAENITGNRIMLQEISGNKMKVSKRGSIAGNKWKNQCRRKYQWIKLMLKKTSEKIALRSHYPF